MELVGVVRNIDLFLFSKDVPEDIDPYGSYGPYGWCATATDEFGNWESWDFCVENCKSMRINAVEESIKICNILKVKTVYYCSRFLKMI